MKKLKKNHKDNYPIEDRALKEAARFMGEELLKVLTADEIKLVKEMMTMTLLGQMLMEDGIEKGEFKTMKELVQDGILTLEAAAARKQMTTEEFENKLRELNFI